MRHNFTYIFFLVVIICVQYPFVQLEAHPDELMSVVLISQKNPYYFLAEIGKDFSPPFFHILMKFFSLFSKLNVNLIRYVNVFIYALSSLVTLKSIDYVYQKKSVANKVVVGISFCFSLGALNLVTQARSNSLSILFSSLSILYILRLIKKSDDSNRYIICLILILGSLTHYYILLLNCCLLVSFYKFFRKSDIKYFIASLFPSVIWAFVFFIKYIHSGGAHWIEQISLNELSKVIAYPFESFFISLVLVLFIFISTVTNKTESNIYIKRFSYTILILFFVTSCISMAGIHIFLDRYFMVIYPLFFFILGLVFHNVGIKGVVTLSLVLTLNFSKSYSGLLKDRSNLGRLIEYIDHDSIVYSYKIHHKILVNAGVKEFKIRELSNTEMILEKGSYIILYEERSDHLNNALKSISINNSINLLNSGANTYLYKVPAKVSSGEL